ncbi:MAG: acyl-CoA dehydrogenase family protein [Acidimicrobiales bacterium]
MRLGLTDDQLAIKEVFAGFFGKESTPAVVRAAEPGGFDSKLWRRVCETGAPGMGVDERAAGGGATLGDLAVVAEEFGRSIAPIPLIDHQVTARALASLGTARSDVTDGETVAAFALRPAVDGAWWLVPGGSVAGLIVGLDGDELVAVESAPPASAPRNHAAQALADRSTTGTRTVLASGDAARAAFDRALNEWKTLTAAALVGVGAQALQMALDYVQTRIQFGKPIGAFQAVQQSLADLPILIDGGRLLAHKAAWAGDNETTGVVGHLDIDDNDNSNFAVLAGMAFVFNADGAAHATDRALHFHGGYGFAEEYDIQLFYRRARGWALVYDDPARECVRLADAMFGPRGSAA